jgi:hypothetical protein
MRNKLTAISRRNGFLDAGYLPLLHRNKLLDCLGSQKGLAPPHAGSNLFEALFDAPIKSNGQSRAVGHVMRHLCSLVHKLTGVIGVDNDPHTIRA